MNRETGEIRTFSPDEIRQMHSDEASQWARINERTAQILKDAEPVARLAHLSRLHRRRLLRAEKLGRKVPAI